jgi:hypothetical protein
MEVYMYLSLRTQSRPAHMPPALYGYVCMLEALCLHQRVILHVTGIVLFRELDEHESACVLHLHVVPVLLAAIPLRRPYTTIGN